MIWKSVAVWLGSVLVCAAVPVWFASSTTGGETRTFTIKARQYAYDPGRIVVNRGDEIHIRLASLDVVHGFFLEGHDIDALIEPGTRVEDTWPPFKFRRPSEGKEYTEVEEIVFTAERSGKFRYRCSHTCGTLHPFMQGELIVGPNYPYLAGIGGAVGMLVAAVLQHLLLPKRDRHSAPASPLASATGQERTE